VTAFDGPDFTDFGCGPADAIDQSFGIGWGSTSDIVDGVATPKSITIRLPRAIDISTIGVDPSNTCGDGGSASTGDYRIETSRNGVRFQQAAAGTFTAADRGRLNLITPAAGTGRRVRFVRFTAISPQVPGPRAELCPGPFSGCDFMDMTELEVYGTSTRH
jgi:extracellular elastinolytic metalloproteinase